MYVDESGDPGKWDPQEKQTASAHYALSGLIIDCDKWKEAFDSLVNIRKILREKYAFPLKKELHGSELFNTRGNMKKGTFTYSCRAERLAIYKTYLEELNKCQSLFKVISVYLDKKETKIDESRWFELVWKDLFERYNTFLKKHGKDDKGIVIIDEGSLAKVTRILRKARVVNFVPAKNRPDEYYNYKLDRIIEDPFEKKSSDSYFVQSADLIVHALYRMIEVKGAYKKYKAEQFYKLIEGLIIKEAAGNDPRQLGIKML